MNVTSKVLTIANIYVHINRQTYKSQNESKVLPDLERTIYDYQDCLYSKQRVWKAWQSLDKESDKQD